MKIFLKAERKREQRHKSQNEHGALVAGWTPGSEQSGREQPRSRLGVGTQMNGTHPVTATGYTSSYVMLKNPVHSASLEI